ncbi:CDP-glycerol glycerophosphotransferase family protein [Flavobacterium suncheonense]|uniref:UDP-glycosyltransferase n=1 Tax=Flavobacterium suncheonense GH29-5 = DSM 17707 TaxID=1121899 RepID=A0A0A2M9R2_9FLAO|nr:CDP-glycerol glycerophosphotransferase family protein [Flavobacterium suncheonense]KGO89417.1 hypothetical protein Q764_08570 [Flavobacterium suncheonense GH29-5 = DSM 17707]
MKKKKIALLFPDGVGVRNYLYSKVFKHTESELVLFHSFDSKTVDEIKGITELKTAIALPKYTESFKERFLRELICLSRLYYNSRLTNNSTILKNWNRNHKSISKKIVYKTIEFVAPRIKKYSTILKLEKAYQNAIRKNVFYIEAKKMLQDIAPDELFCSHQRGIQCAPFFAAASDLGILNTTVIFSWDNLPKARMALRADNYLVWSDYMKEEMKLYYPEIPQEAIHVTGTPQFEFYSDSSNVIPRDEFYKRYGLDPAKKIICYSGDDVLTSPDDPKYLSDLAEELIKGNLTNDYQILLRRCPVDLSNRFATVIAKFPDLIKEAPPIWNFKDKENWTTVYALPEDVKLLVSTVFYSDVVVNLGSTMAFDFAMFEKPCIFINYDQKDKTVPSWTVNEVYKFQHFRSIPNNKAVVWWDKKEDLGTIVNSISGHSINHVKDWKNIVMTNDLVASIEIRKKLGINTEVS